MLQSILMCCIGYMDVSYLIEDIRLLSRLAGADEPIVEHAGHAGVVPDIAALAAVIAIWFLYSRVLKPQRA